MIRICKKYKRIKKEGSCEYTVQKSRFIGYGTPVHREKEAFAFIEKVKKTEPDANHHVYAYIIGKNSEVQKFSDDGEPSGTAGKPILEMLKRETLVNTIIVITRYFGGIKLGAGGLIRAYAKGAKEVIEHNGIVTIMLYELINLEFDYQYWGKLDNELRNHEIYQFKSVDFDQKVHCQVYIPINQQSELNKTFMNLTNGQGKMEKICEEYLKEE